MKSHRKPRCCQALETAHQTQSTFWNLYPQSIQLTKDMLDGSLEIKSIMKQMEGMVHYLRESLSSIPRSPFREHECAQTLFEASPSQLTEIGQYPSAASSTPEVDRSSIQSQAQLSELLRNPSKRSSHSLGRITNSSAGVMQDVAQYVEPLYGSFFCPLTRKIMEDPVTIQSGATYERQAISEWFERLEEDTHEAACLATGQKLSSKAMYRNVALQNIIEEWKGRNETAKIKVIQTALSLASSERMVMEAPKDLKTICQRQPERVREVRSKGIVPSLVKFLEYKDSIIRHLTLEILQQLAEDDEGKI